MKEKVLKSEAILQDILDDKENVTRSDLTVLKEALDLFELCIKQEVFLSVVASSDDKKKVLDELEGLIAEYEREIALIKTKPISYQVNEGNSVVVMLQRYISELESVKNGINNGDYLDMVEPFNVESEREDLVNKLIDIITKSGIASYFVKLDVLEKDGYKIDYDKIDTLFDLLSSEELMSQVSDVLPAAKKKVKAAIKVADEEAKLHKATCLKEHEGEVVVYLAKTNMAERQDRHVQELVDDLGEARRELNNLTSETRLFQTVCKKEIEEQRQKVTSIRFRKIVARNILNSIETTLSKMEMEFKDLKIDGLVKKLVDGRKVSCSIVVPGFLKTYPRAQFTWVKELERASAIKTDIDSVLSTTESCYAVAERRYLDASTDFDGALDTLSHDAQEFIKGDIDTMVAIYDFMKEVVNGNYNVFVALFTLKLLNDASSLTFDELVEFFGDEEEVKGLREYYEVIMGHYAYGKRQEICDIQDSYMLESQDYTIYAKHL